MHGLEASIRTLARNASRNNCVRADDTLSHAAKDGTFKLSAEFGVECLTCVVPDTRTQESPTNRTLFGPIIVTCSGACPLATSARFLPDQVRV